MVHAMKVHLDTDLGGDPDDACALAMLLGWPGVELVGITTVLDRGARRAGMVAEFLRRAGRGGVPIAAGAHASLTTGFCPTPKDDDHAYWGQPIAPLESPPGAALELLSRSIEQGATVIAIGSLTNLAMLEVCRSGALENAHVVVMGGWITPPRAGLPDWGPEMDWNVQCDTRAAHIALAAARTTLVTLPVTLEAHLRARDVPRLEASGPLGELLARQSVAHSVDGGIAELPATFPELPADLLNFHYDPVATAVALGWPGAVVEPMRLRLAMQGDVLRFIPDAAGKPTQVLTGIDAGAFGATWMERVEAAQR